jgi:hypothetical protein
VNNPSNLRPAALLADMPLLLVFNKLFFDINAKIYVNRCVCRLKKPLYQKN